MEGEQIHLRKINRLNVELELPKDMGQHNMEFNSNLIK
jgi:hypothetical protein